MSIDFDARAYWEARLGADWSLTGVGLRRLGRRFNVWAYRVRREIFLEIVAARVPDLSHARVLDVGSGTGFYIDRWREAGVASVAALDLTEAAAGRLRERYPTITVVRADIGAPLEPALLEARGSFDIVSAMDVLFHIVDDDAFALALRNTRELLRPGGTFIWSDAFSHHLDTRVEHRASRTLSEVERLLDAAGFDIVVRTPMFVLMNEPVDVRRRSTLRAWQAMMGPASLAEPLGGFMGWLLYPLESRLVRRRRESPTTEIMVCRAR